ncbi:hypothetical protein BS47DRAFT_1402684 [Hydnum rufescens UP504]|uniref:Cytochrome b5 heme-binding domain-containing protein n=1 Tax=Hydnum rufescens UP504 TaxID=1448309 RepID=A0A9P6ABW5_9AGAM|nr:hypothetical protein BS47DRAFT_1402684 [Hydnum rufescens UP504]
MWNYPFYIIPFGHLLCPGQNSVWSEAELGGHSTPTNFWVVVAGEVYNITPFWGGNHSNVAAVPVTQTNVLELAGAELAQYFPVPLVAGCLGFVTDASLALQAENFSAQVPNAMHYSGQHTSLTEALMSEAWYLNVFPPTMKQYRKGSLSTKDNIAKQANDGKNWAYWHNEIFDLSDYIYALQRMNQASNYLLLREWPTVSFHCIPPYYRDEDEATVEVWTFNPLVGASGLGGISG